LHTAKVELRLPDAFADVLLHGHSCLAIGNGAICRFANQAVLVAVLMQILVVNTGRVAP